MSISREEYSRMADKASPPSKCVADFFKAFLVGGLICVIGELIFELLMRLGIDEDKDRLIVSASLIVLSAVLTGIGVYDIIASFAGAGTLVPITGFANAVVSPALDNKPEGKILGVGTQMFSIAGPVIVYGTISAMLYGAFYYLFKVVF